MEGNNMHVTVLCGALKPITFLAVVGKNARAGEALRNAIDWRHSGSALPDQ
jgi:hypothetical protein